MPMTRHQGITNRSKAKSQNARNCGPTTGFPAKSNTLSRQLLPISQADLHSSQTTKQLRGVVQCVGHKALPDYAGGSATGLSATDAYGTAPKPVMQDNVAGFIWLRYGQEALIDYRSWPRLCRKTDISTALRPHRRQLARLNIFLLEAISGRAWRSLGRLLASI